MANADDLPDAGAHKASGLLASRGPLWLEVLSRNTPPLPDDASKTLAELQVACKLALSPAILALIGEEYARFASRRSRPNDRPPLNQRGRYAALAHAKTLLRYLLDGPSRDRSVSHRARLLADALTMSPIWMEVQVETSAEVWMPAVLAGLKDGIPPDVVMLRRIVHALTSIALDNSKRPGRSSAPQARIARLGFIIWLDSGRAPRVSWNPSYDMAAGPMAEFMRRFFRVFGVHASGHTVKEVIRRLRRDPMFVTAGGQKVPTSDT